MNQFQQFVGTQVDVEISGGTSFTGILVDNGLDIIVIFNGQRFFYIPTVHVQQLKVSSSLNEQTENPSEIPFKNVTESISYRKMLNEARGRFVEIYVTGGKSIHGYLTSIMNDYFLFYSPVYKAMFVSLNHLKWLIPYPSNVTPYSLNNQSLPVNPTSVTLSRTFTEQCKKLEGKLVVFDLGDHPNKIGQLLKVENNTLELVTANSEKVYWNLQHLKTIYLP